MVEEERCQAEICPADNNRCYLYDVCGYEENRAN